MPIDIAKIRNDLSVALFQARYIDTQVPVLISGLQEGWPAQALWGSDYLRSRCGDVTVEIRDYRPASGDAGKPYAKVPMRIADYLDYWDGLEAGAKPERNLYLAEWNFVHQCPTLLEDFATPAYFSQDWINRLPPKLRYGRLWIFIGHPGVYTPVHTDTFSTSAWIAVVHGTKVIRLVAPQHGSAVRKGIDLFAPEAEAELAGRGVPLYEAVVQAGDVLSIPGRWFHQVRNRDKTIMVTENFADTANLLSFLSEFETQLLKPIRVLRDLRNQFIADLLGGPAGPSLGVGAPACVRSLSFLDEQLRWSAEFNQDIEQYRSHLSTLRGLAAEGGDGWTP